MNTVEPTAVPVVSSSPSSERTSKDKSNDLFAALFETAKNARLMVKDQIVQQGREESILDTSETVADRLEKADDEDAQASAEDGSVSEGLVNQAGTQDVRDQQQRKHADSIERQQDVARSEDAQQQAVREQVNEEASKLTDHEQKVHAEDARREEVIENQQESRNQTGKVDGAGSSEKADSSEASDQQSETQTPVMPINMAFPSFGMPSAKSGSQTAGANRTPINMAAATLQVPRGQQNSPVDAPAGTATKMVSQWTRGMGIHQPAGNGGTGTQGQSNNHSQSNASTTGQQQASSQAGASASTAVGKAASSPAGPTQLQDFQQLMESADRTRGRLAGPKQVDGNNQSQKSEQGASIKLTQTSGVRELAQVLRAQTGAKQSSMSLRLDPPELGRLHIDARMQGGTLTVRLQAETTAARDALQNRLDHLRSALEEQGIKLGQVDVEIRPAPTASSQHLADSQQDLNDQQQSQNQNGAHSGAHAQAGNHAGGELGGMERESEQSPTHEASAEEPPADATERVGESSSVDLVA
jgi:flagellar hook-length control protein FliK